MGVTDFLSSISGYMCLHFLSVTGFLSPVSGYDCICFLNVTEFFAPISGFESIHFLSVTDFLASISGYKCILGTDSIRGVVKGEEGGQAGYQGHLHMLPHLRRLQDSQGEHAGGTWLWFQDCYGEEGVGVTRVEGWFVCWYLLLGVHSLHDQGRSGDE